MVKKVDAAGDVSWWGVVSGSLSQLAAPWVIWFAVVYGVLQFAYGTFFSITSTLGFFLSLFPAKDSFGMFLSYAVAYVVVPPVLILLLTLLFSLANAYLFLRIMGDAGLTRRRFSFGDFADYFMIGAVPAIQMVYSLRNKNFLAIPLLALPLLVFARSVGLLLLGLYYCVVLYYTLRLILSPFAFFRGGVSYYEACDESYRLTKGHPVTMGLVIVPVSAVAGIIPGLLKSVLQQATGLSAAPLLLFAGGIFILGLVEVLIGFAAFRYYSAFSGERPKPVGKEANSAPMPATLPKEKPFSGVRLDLGDLTSFAFSPLLTKEGIKVASLVGVPMIVGEVLKVALLLFAAKGVYGVWTGDVTVINYSVALFSLESFAAVVLFSVFLFVVFKHFGILKRFATSVLGGLFAFIAVYGLLSGFGRGLDYSVTHDIAYAKAFASLVITLSCWLGYVLIGALFYSVPQAFAMSRALTGLGLSKGGFSLRKSIDYLLIGLSQGANTLFCTRNPKFLLLPIASLVSLAVFGVSALPLAVIPVVAYFLFVLYSFVKVSFALPALLSGSAISSNAVSTSYDLTRGRGVEVSSNYLSFLIFANMAFRVVDGIVIAAYAVAPAIWPAYAVAYAFFFGCMQLVVCYSIVYLYVVLSGKKLGKGGFQGRRNSRGSSPVGGSWRSAALVVVLVAGAALVLVNSHVQSRSSFENSPRSVAYSNENFSFSYPENFVADYEGLKAVQASYSNESSDYDALLFARDRTDQTAFLVGDNELAVLTNQGAEDQFNLTAKYAFYKNALDNPSGGENFSIVGSGNSVYLYVGNPDYLPFKIKDFGNSSWVFLRSAKDSTARLALTSCGHQFITLIYIGNLLKTQAAVDKITETFVCRVPSPTQTRTDDKNARLLNFTRETRSLGILGNITDARFDRLLSDVKNDKFASPVQILQSAGRAVVYRRNVTAEGLEGHYSGLYQELAALSGDFKVSALSFKPLRAKDYFGEYFDTLVVTMATSDGRVYELTDFFKQEYPLDYQFYELLNKPLADSGSPYRFYSARFTDWSVQDYPVSDKNTSAIILLTEQQAQSLRLYDYSLYLSYENHADLTTGQIDSLVGAFKSLGLLSHLSDAAVNESIENIHRAGPISRSLELLRFFPNTLLSIDSEDYLYDRSYANATAELSVLSRGEFEPTDVEDNASEIMAATWSEDYPYSYNVSYSFKFNGKKYASEIPFDGGYLNFEFVGLINRALSESGSSNRYYETDWDGYVFINSTQKAAIARSGLFNFSEYPSQAYYD